MERSYTAARISTMRKIGWLGVASMLALALLAPAAGPVLAAAGQSVTICHGTGSNSNPYIKESPSVQANGATEGQLTGGHSNHVGPVWFDGIGEPWGDIIPPYVYIPNGFNFPGLNWTTAGQAIWNAACGDPVTTTTTTTGTSTTTTTTGTTTTGTTTTSTSSTTTTTDTTTTGTTTTGTTTTGTTTTTTTTGTTSVLAETDVPVVTLPPTDGISGSAAPSSESWRMLLIVAAALLASVMVMAPTKVARRRR